MPPRTVPSGARSTRTVSSPPPMLACRRGEGSDRDPNACTSSSASDPLKCRSSEVTNAVKPVHRNRSAPPSTAVRARLSTSQVPLVAAGSVNRAGPSTASRVAPGAISVAPTMETPPSLDPRPAYQLVTNRDAGGSTPRFTCSTSGSPGTPTTTSSRPPAVRITSTSESSSITWSEWAQPRYRSAPGPSSVRTTSSSKRRVASTSTLSSPGPAVTLRPPPGCCPVRQIRSSPPPAATLLAPSDTITSSPEVPVTFAPGEPTWVAVSPWQRNAAAAGVAVRTGTARPAARISPRVAGTRERRMAPTVGSRRPPHLRRG